MDLQEEYFRRRKVPAFLVKYTDRANLILHAKPGVSPEWSWLHVSIATQQEPNHPVKYRITVAANPVIYASADFSHFSYHNTKILKDESWEWEQYEPSLVKWATEQAKQYVAITSDEAVFVSWEMFLSNYDSWLANFLPHRIIDMVYQSLDGSKSERLACIKNIESWISDKYERVYACWANIKQNIDHRSYADWLAELVNSERS